MFKLGTADTNLLRRQVRETYSAIAMRPGAEHVFPVGRALAENLGYPKDLLESLPAPAVDAFAGVSNVSIFAELPEGSTVLDLGCGAGMDSLIAAQRVGATGFVVGVDFSDAMLERARSAAAESRTGNACFLRAESEHLPLAGGSVDVALVNGIFNLNPQRARILTELVRVLRPEGSAYGAELILRQPLPEEVKTSEANWFA